MDEYWNCSGVGWREGTTQKTGCYKVERARLTDHDLHPDSTVSDMASYSTECAVHGDSCGGHYTRSKHGAILPPSGCVTLTPFPCTFAQAVKDLLSGVSSRAEYEERVRAEVLNTKHGAWRSDCQTGDVLGSMRMVIIPASGYRYGTIVLPRDAAERTMVPYLMDDGSVSCKRMSDCKWCIAVRPPTIYPGSARPLLIDTWDKSAIGVPQDSCVDCHGDFDGDEMQIYGVCDAASEAECEAWRLPGTKVLMSDAAEPVVDGMVMHDGSVDWYSHTTRPLSYGGPLTHNERLMLSKDATSNALATKLSHFEHSPWDFMLATESGLKSIMDQQLPLGTLGHETRTCRVVCSEVSSQSYTMQSPVMGKLDMMQRCPPGYPGFTGICKLCAVLQQRSLDAHRMTQGRGGTNAARMVINGCGDHTALSIMASHVDHPSVVQQTPMAGGTLVVTRGAGLVSQISLYHVIASTSPTIVRRAAVGNIHTAMSVYAKGVMCAASCLDVELTTVEAYAIAMAVVPSIIQGVDYPLNIGDASRAECTWVTRMLASYCTVAMTDGMRASREKWTTMTTMGAMSIFSNYRHAPSAV